MVKSDLTHDWITFYMIEQLKAKIAGLKIANSLHDTEIQRKKTQLLYLQQRSKQLSDAIGFHDQSIVRVDSRMLSMNPSSPTKIRWLSEQPAASPDTIQSKFYQSIVNTQQQHLAISSPNNNGWGKESRMTSGLKASIIVQKNEEQDMDKRIVRLREAVIGLMGTLDDSVLKKLNENLMKEKSVLASTCEKYIKLFETAQTIDAMKQSLSQNLARNTDDKPLQYQQESLSKKLIKKGITKKMASLIN